VNETKRIRISVREFALPSPRTGSIDSHSGYGRSALDGIEIHQQVQAKRKREDDLYEAEVKTARIFARGNYEFFVEGRIDGIFRHETPRIEEIKSSFNIRELARAIEERKSPEGWLDHPYALQLLSYGYFHWKDHDAIPELSLHLVSSRNRETLDLGLELDVLAYESWVDLRLAELEAEAIRADKRAARRRKLAAGFAFPFENPRPGQVELVAEVEAGMRERKRMMVQAPTGLGKTVGVLYPALKEALGRGQRVVYVTPKNSQHTVAEDAVERFQGCGSNVKGLTFTAKSKICMKAEPLCNAKYCEYAKDYYEKVARHGLLAELGKKRVLSARTFRRMAETYEVCPFELQLDAAGEADVVICDYNYVFSPNSAFGRLSSVQYAGEGNPNLVIDEAHNLPSRTMDYYSPALTAFALEKIREDFVRLPKRLASEAAELLDEAIDILAELRPAELAGKTGQGSRIELPTEPFLEHDANLRTFLTRYLESDVEIEPGDPVLRMVFYWGQFTEILQEISESASPEFFATFQADRFGGDTVKITCCDASKRIAERYDEYEQVVAFSATLKPFEYYARLSGLEGERLKVSEFLSPFDGANRKLLIIPQVSTKYSDRERNYPRIADAIARIAALRKGNYLAFFPSFDFARRVAEVFRVPEGFDLRVQERSMSRSSADEALAALREGSRPTLLFAVQGGIFSEGIDYPGEMAVGVFVVGTPLPTFDIERETMRKYYDEHYREGFGYAYAYPAMAKAVQSAGRVIRTEQDRGVIVLMDVRFMDPEYSKSMPSDWFATSPRELVSKSILRDVSEFWARAGVPSRINAPAADQDRPTEHFPNPAEGRVPFLEGFPK
jgi:DNA excision repair protein ERCC-2